MVDFCKVPLYEEIFWPKGIWRRQMLIFLQTGKWIYIHQTIVICWVECRLVYNWRFCSQDQNYILYLHSTQQVDALHHPRSPLVVKYIPDIYVKNEGLTDILWKAGVACYRILVAHCRGGYTGRQYKKRYSLLRKIRLTSYVGLNADQYIIKLFSNLLLISV